MPKVPIDYAKTIIYKIVCNNLSVTDNYVGHTTDFVRRKQSHKNRCTNEKDKKHNFKIYRIIRENGGWINWSMIEIEKFPCETVFEACRQERYHYELLNSTLNMIYPQRSQKEYYEIHKKKINERVKEYYVANKKKVKERILIYKDSHKEELKEKKNKRHICECGKEFSAGNKSRHLKSNIHKRLSHNLTEVNNYSDSDSDNGK
jgi:hypothetical protein